MRYLILLWVWVYFATGALSSAETEPKSNSATERIVAMVVNRNVTPDDRRRPGRIVSAYSYADFLDLHDENPKRESRLSKIKEVLKTETLKVTPFSVEFTETELGDTVGDVVILTPDRVVAVPTGEIADGKRAPEFPRVSLEDIENRIASPDFESESALRDLIIWTTEAPAERLAAADYLTFRDARVNKVFQALLPKQNTRGPAPPVFRASAARLTRAQRFNVFKRVRSAPPSLYPVFNGLWQILESEHPDLLLEDFRAILEAVDAKRSKIKFVAEGHRLELDPADAELSEQIRFLSETLVRVRADVFSKVLPRSFREWAALDTNGFDPATRTEPIDILTYGVRPWAYPFAADASLTDPARNEIIKLGIRHTLIPERVPAEIRGARGVTRGDHDTAQSAYFVYCVGEELGIPTQPNFTVGSTSLVSTLTLAEDRLRELREKTLELPLRCGSERATLTVPIERLKAPLEDPVHAKFEVGKDRRIKAISTLNLVDSLGEGYLEKIILAGLRRGYLLIEKKTIDDPLEHFLSEILNADFYFPTNHNMNASSFLIGQPGGTKLRFVRLFRGVVQELVLLVPPKTKAGIEAIFTEEDVIELFRLRRRPAPDQPSRRLIVMAMACNSKLVPEHWMRYYKKSLEKGLDGLRAREQAELLKTEVPVAIGADREFKTDLFTQLREHSRYPFEILDLAATETPFREWLEHLKDYKPVSSLGHEVYFDVGAQEDAITIQVKTERGRTITF